MPAPQSAQEKPTAFDWYAGRGAPGSCFWTLKIRFDVGKSMPRISCAMLPTGGNDGADDAVEPGGLAAPGGAGIAMAFSTASSAPSSVCPAGNLATCSM